MGCLTMNRVTIWSQDQWQGQSWAPPFNALKFYFQGSADYGLVKVLKNSRLAGHPALNLMRWTELSRVEHKWKIQHWNWVQENRHISPCTNTSIHGIKGFVIPTKSFVKTGVAKTFCYNNKMFRSINKTFGCCNEIFGCSNKKLFVVPNFVVTEPFFPCTIPIRL